MKIKNLNDIQAIRDYHARIGAEAVSFRRAEIRETTPQGYPKAVVVIVYDRKAKSVKLYPDRKDKAPSDDELKAILDGLAEADFPNSTVADSLPNHLFDVDPEMIFAYWNENHTKVGFVEHRINDERGGKIYLPWTYFDDGEWRQQEPDDGLPLYGVWGLRDGPKRVMVHEGAKAARGAQRAADDPGHPFHESMKLFTHLGWSGGTERARSTRWGMLKGIDDITICPDNDLPGKRVLRQLSQLMPRPATVQAVNWPADFPTGFDLGDTIDKIPQKYIDHHWQPTEDRLVLTWATEETTIGDKTVYYVRESFGRQWVYISNNDLFVEKKHPSRFYPRDVFDNHFRAFSHVKKLSDLMLTSEHVERYFERTYLPGLPIGSFTDNSGNSVLNVYTPTRVKPSSGDVTPWIDFLSYLFPVDSERQEVADFVATLIARPQNRPGYGLLMYSIKQGTGKSTLTNFLETLVGHHNASSPDAKTIVDSSFNTWLANKVLVVCAEIYEGHSWKAYLALKSAMTERSITLKEKYMTDRLIPNHVWFVACSNSPQAMRIEEGDRRWLVPTVTEEPRPKKYFVELYAWFENGGAAMVLDWALNYARPYLSVANAVPMTNRKSEMIEGSEEDDIRNARSIVEYIADKRSKEGKPPSFYFDMGQLRSFAQRGVDQRDLTNSKQFTQKLLQKGIIEPYKRVKRAGDVMRTYIYTPTVDGIVSRSDDFVNLSDCGLDDILSM